jgi:hypothetical protein
VTSAETEPIHNPKASRSPRPPPHRERFTRRFRFIPGAKQASPRDKPKASRSPPIPRITLLIEASGTPCGAPPPPSNNNVLSLLGESGPGRRFPFSLFPDFPDGAPSRPPVEGARERFRFISVVSPGLRQSHATVFCLPSSPRFPMALRFSPGLSIPLIEASGTSRGAPPPPSNNVLSLLGESGPGRRFPFSLFPDFPDGAPSRLPVEGAR